MMPLYFIARALSSFYWRGLGVDTECFALARAGMHTSAYWTPAFAGETELDKMSFILAYAGDAEYMRVPDNRKALDGLWELSIIVPLAAFSRHAILRRVGASQTLRLGSG